MPEEPLYSPRVGLAFMVLLLAVAAVVFSLMLGGCAASCKHQTGDGICVDNASNKIG